MMLLWLDFLNLNGYASLWDKYHDTSEVKNVSGLHDWIVANKKDFQNFLFQNHYFKTLYLYKKAFKNNDWDTMHEIMLEFWEIETE